MWRTAWIALLLGASASAQPDTPPDQNPRYFPIDAFAGSNLAHGDFLARWYAEQLRAMQEPSLSESAPAGDTIYRFTWLRSFHHPIAVRMAVHPDGAATLTVKMADGEGGYAPGELVVNATREISAKETRRALDLFTAMDFWRMPTEQAFDGVGLDGAHWILEASTADRYHVVDRWSVQVESGPFRELGLYLVNTLGKLHVPRKEVY